MTTLAKTSNLFPSLVKDFFEGEKFLRPGYFDLENNFMNFGFGTRVPSVNIWETDKDFKLEMAAPGLERKDFKIEFDRMMLTITVEKEEKKEEKAESYKRKEFSFTSFSRTFELPENILTDKIEAHYENGILRVLLPKKEVIPSKPKKEIKVV